MNSKSTLSAGSLINTPPVDGQPYTTQSFLLNSVRLLVLKGGLTRHEGATMSVSCDPSVLSRKSRKALRESGVSRIKPDPAWRLSR